MEREGAWNNRVFCPGEHQYGLGLVTAFSEFVASFQYAYRSLNRRPPIDVNTEPLRRAWEAVDKQQVFLGRFVDRELQKRLEDISDEETRHNIKFDNMVKLLKKEFQKNSNQTLANYKFYLLAQEAKESFDNFCIRVKREVKSSNAT